MLKLRNMNFLFFCYLFLMLLVIFSSNNLMAMPRKGDTNKGKKIVDANEREVTKEEMNEFISELDKLSTEDRNKILAMLSNPEMVKSLMEKAKTEDRASSSKTKEDKKK
ncbi:hypothetical protein ['Camptotheca acuminata' phytoplasma]|uniref:hypothetical protein n=1 Tax='Camptotheca acuminata' phytoplasma TaxID=3239192 RepID=UPI00351A9275